MEDQQRVRLIILAISGVLFGAGAYGYFWYQEQKQTAQLDEAPITVRPTVKPASTVQLASNAGTTTGATVPAVNIAPATQTGTVTPPAQQPVVAQQPLAATQPATTPATGAQTPTQPAQVKTPTQLPPAVKPATQVASAPPISTPPKVTPPAATAPVATAPTTTPSPTAAAPTTPDGTVAAASPTPAVVVPAGQYPATVTAAAAAEAKQRAGRPDPVEPQFAFLPFPRNGVGQQTPSSQSALASLPPPQKPMPTKINEKLVPPPPPTEAMPGLPGPNSVAGGLPIDQLPVPPSRPTIGDKMRVLGLFDDKAIICFPKGMAVKNKWPKTITLGTGEQFESITVVGINRDGVTIEEDGERTVKPITAVK